MPKICIVDKFTNSPLLLPYIPDGQSVYNQITACVHRFGRSMPSSEPRIIEKFVSFAKSFITKAFNPILEKNLTSFNEWLQNSSYSGNRVEYLKKIRQSLIAHDPKMAESKSFIKWECYQEPKHARAINSYTDESKTLLGALFSDIDNSTFATKWFVKHTNPREWPILMRDLFGKSPVMETDFSSFEAHHRDEFCEVIIFWMMHMMRNVGNNGIRRMLHKMVRGVNRTKFQSITAKIVQRLMSGAMWTSSANGVLNLCIMAFLNTITKHPGAPPEVLAELAIREFVGLVEGDDGISVDVDVDPKLIEDLGLDLKYKKQASYTDASFCGVVCDEKTLVSVTNPMKVLRNFFALPKKYVDAKDSTHLSLLRAKALSYKYNFNNCPIVGALCHRICDLTKSQSIERGLSEIDAWKRRFVQIANDEKLWMKVPDVDPEMRVLVHEHFGISPIRQMIIEEEIYASKDVIALTLHDLISPTDVEHFKQFCGRTVHSYRAPSIPSNILEIHKEGLKRQRKHLVSAAADRSYSVRFPPLDAYVM